MAHSGSRIYIDTSVTPNIGIDPQADIAVVLHRRGVGDVGQLCRDCDKNGNILSPRKINIWSKVKPTEVAGKVGDLTEADRYGTASDHSSGIYWGIQINVPTTPNIGNIHTSSFTWSKRPSTQFRETDFNGYDHAAVPNPAGSVATPATGYVDVGSNGNGKFEGLYAYFVQNNTTGVDFSAILFDSQSIDLTKVYPCIVIKTEVSSGVYKNYFTALTNSNGDIPKPLKYNNAYPGDALYADLTKVVYSSNPSQTPQVPPVFAPSSGAERINTVSLCLMELYNGTLLVPGTNEDMATYWFDASDGIVASSKVVPIPDCTGLPIAFRNAQNGVKVDNTKISLGSQFMTLAFSVVDSSMATLASYNVTLDITFTMSGNTTYITRTTTASELFSMWTVPNKLLDWTADFGLVGPPSAAFSLTVQVSCGSYHRTSTYTNKTYSQGAEFTPDSIQ